MAHDQAHRVNYASRVILSGRPTTRAFDNCFEMNDGHTVAAKVYRRALKNPAIMAALPKYLDVALCRSDYFDLYGDKSHAGALFKALQGCVAELEVHEKHAKETNDVTLLYRLNLAREALAAALPTPAPEVI